MARLNSIRGDISFELLFKDNSFRVVDSSKPDIENWFPIYFNFSVFKEEYSAVAEVSPTINLYEAKTMIDKLSKVIEVKKKGENFQQCSISTYEFYYEMEIFDPDEDDEIGVILWLFEATRTNGELNGFDRGFRFYVSVDSLERFTNSFEKELKAVL